MGSFSTGIGLISGLDSASIIDYILQGEGRGRLRLQSEIASLQGRQAAMLGINSHLLSLRSASESLLGMTVFGATTATSSAPGVLTAITGHDAVPGTWSFMVSRLAAHHQSRSAGFSSSSSALGLDSFCIDLGDGGSLTSDIDLALLNGGGGVDRGVIELTVGSTVTEVDLSDVVTLGDVVERLQHSGADITVDYNENGLQITSGTGEAISARSLGGVTTAGDLGLLGDGSSGVLEGSDIIVLGTEIPLSALNDGQGVLVCEGTPDLRITTTNGSVHDVTIPQGALTLGDVLSAIEVGTNGTVQASIAPDGLRIRLVDTTGSGGLLVESTAGNPSAAVDLGLEGMQAVGVELEGARLLADCGSVLLSRLMGGAGIEDGTMTVVDRTGASGSVILDERYETPYELIVGFNTSLAAQGVQAHVELNATGTGLRLVDDSGAETSNLVVSGSLAVSLGLAGDVEAGSIEGVDLQHQSISRSTTLAMLNGGRGVAAGSFTIRDATGASAEVAVGASVVTVDDLLQLIGSKGLAIDARLNDDGDGIELVSTASESASTVHLQVTAESGTTAGDLRLLGEADAVFGGEARINGSSTVQIDVDADTTLEQLAELIGASNVGVSASLVNTGSGSTPWHLLLQSQASGAAGRFIVDARRADGTTLDLSTTVEGQDAVAWLGDNPADALLLRSSTNTIAGTVPGLTLDLLSVSDTPVVVTVQRDDASALSSIRNFVDACNAVFDGLSEVDSYDPETGQRGVLLGDATVARVQRALQSMIHGRIDGGASLDALREIGITIEAGGRLGFDEARCAAQLESDPEGVAALFNAEADEAVAGDPRGFAVRCFDLLEDLTDPSIGPLALSDERWGDRIAMAQGRIEDITARLEVRRLHLESRFAAMELAIASLQSQGVALLAFGNSYASFNRG